MSACFVAWNGQKQRRLLVTDDFASEAFGLAKVRMGRFDELGDAQNFTRLQVVSFQWASRLMVSGGVVGAEPGRGLHTSKLCGISKLQMDDGFISNSPSA
jgi:hypothetical protein